jgi:hypothetical protein
MKKEALRIIESAETSIFVNYEERSCVTQYRGSFL